MTHPAEASVVPTGRPAGGDDPPGRPVPRRARAIVAALAATQTVGYGALYYSFAVLLAPLAHDLHTSTTAVTGALTAATLAGAAAAVPVGRWLDRHGARALMTTGSAAGTVLLALLSTVHTLTALYAVWIGIGIACAMCLYEAAFAVIVTWYRHPQRLGSALLAVTVVAGFASSIFLPLTGAVIHAYGWRTGVLVLAAVHGVLTIPLHAVVLRRPERSAGPHRHQSNDAVRQAAVRLALHDRDFWLLAVAFLAQAAAVSTLTVHLVAYLIQLGHPATFAATIAGLLGVLSVTGRLAITGLQRRTSLPTVVAAVFTIQAIAAASLPLIGRTTLGAVTAVIGFGLGFGVATIARPAMLAARYDTSGYATISGILGHQLVVWSEPGAAATVGLAALDREVESTGSGGCVVGGGSVWLALGASALRSPRPSRGDERNALFCRGNPVGLLDRGWIPLHPCRCGAGALTTGG
jgi:MFS family permease